MLEFTQPDIAMINDCSFENILSEASETSSNSKETQEKEKNLKDVMAADQIQISNENLFHSNADPCNADDPSGADAGKSEELSLSCSCSTLNTDLGHFKIANNFNKKNSINKKSNNKKLAKNEKTTKKNGSTDNIVKIIHDFNNTKNEFTVSQTISNENLAFFNPIETSFNFQGNYQNYVTRVIRSLPPLFEVNYTDLIQQRLVLLPEYNKKKTLILDLDETLIHADFGRRFINHDHTVTFYYEEEEVSVGIFVRPGVKEFLKRVSEIFEIFRID